MPTDQAGEHEYQGDLNRSAEEAAEAKMGGILHSAEKADSLRSVLLGQAFLTREGSPSDAT
jgi:hypothetical protein